MASWFDVWCVLGPTRNTIAKWRRTFGEDIDAWCASDVARARWQKVGCSGEVTAMSVASQAEVLRHRADDLIGAEVGYFPFAELPPCWKGVVSSPYLCVAGALPSPGIGVVGTRSITAQNRPRIAELLERWLASTTLSVSSGGAFGVDTVAHSVAMKLKRPVVVVLAGGLLHASPVENRQQFWEIARSGGAVVTEKPPAYPQRRHDFLRRNLLIAASARCVLVVRSDPKGGAMNTARRARELGRPVGVVPGAPWAPNTPGTNSLLNLGARACYDEASFAQLLSDGEAAFRQGGLWDWAELSDRSEPRDVGVREKRSGNQTAPQEGPRRRGGAPQAARSSTDVSLRSPADVSKTHTTDSESMAIVDGGVESEIVRQLADGTATTEALSRNLAVDIATLQRTLLIMVLDGVVIDGVDGYRLPPLQR
jgi:DNA protecting protein DprA